MPTGLATRCPSCNTVFRVVPDQLRVSEGWVRCGRCAEVFNAAAALIDLETGKPQPPPADLRIQRAPPPPPPAPKPAGSAATAATADGGIDLPLDMPAAAPATAQRADGEALPTVDDSASRFAHDFAPDFVPDSLPHSGHAPDSAPGPAETPRTGSAPGPDAPLESAGPPPPGPTRTRNKKPRPKADPTRAAPAATQPGFLRQAERNARWSRTPVRAALGFAAVLGTVALVGQVLIEYRELAAARFPALRPALVQSCAWLGCRVGAAMSIDGLTVESSGLVRVERSNLYRLNVALRNRRDIELALPALELSLTDGQGQLLSRRVLRTSELGLSQGTLAPGRDLALQATLQLATEPVAGYTIELFYP